MLNQYHELPSLKIPSEFPCDMIDLILLVINSITCKLSVASKLDTLKTRVTSLILWNDLKKKTFISDQGNITAVPVLLLHI
jgi:hypothetical protein